MPVFACRCSQGERDGLCRILLLFLLRCQWNLVDANAPLVLEVVAHLPQATLSPIPFACFYFHYNTHSIHTQRDNAIPVRAANNYVVACAVVTFLLTLVIVAAHFHNVASTLFVGTKIEGIVTIVLVAFWTAIVAVDVEAGDGLAPVDEPSDAVQNGNLYYFSWAGFILSIVILVSFLRDAFGVDLVGQARHHGGARLQWWASLLAASIIVLGCASQVLAVDCKTEDNEEATTSYCRKTKWAISAGFFNMLLCGLVIASKVLKYTAVDAATPFMLEFGSAGFLTVINVFAVAYITSADSPGSAIGNLYYFSWAIFLLAVVLLSECYTEFTQPPTSTDITTSSENGSQYNQNGRGDIDVETLDENL
jgi:hypothetical protein